MAVKSKAVSSAEPIRGRPAPADLAASASRVGAAATALRTCATVTVSSAAQAPPDRVAMLLVPPLATFPDHCSDSACDPPGTSPSLDAIGSVTLAVPVVLVWTSCVSGVAGLNGTADPEVVA